MNKITEILEIKVPLLSWSTEKDGLTNLTVITTEVSTLLGLALLLAVIVTGVTYVN